MHKCECTSTGRVLISSSFQKVIVTSAFVMLTASCCRRLLELTHYFHPGTSFGSSHLLLKLLHNQLLLGQCGYWLFTHL